MPKYNNLTEYIDTFNEDAIQFYQELKSIIKEIDLDILERLFAGQLAFYVEDTLKSTFHSSPVIVIAFYKDHANIFANDNINHKNKLKNYKFTDKGTLQIYYNQPIEYDILKVLFINSLK